MSDVGKIQPRSARFTGSIARNVAIGGPATFAVDVGASDWKTALCTYATTTGVGNTLSGAGRRGIRYLISRDSSVDVGEYIGDYSYPAVFYSASFFGRTSENLTLTGVVYAADCFFSGNSIFLYLIRTSGSGNVTLNYAIETFR